MYSKFKATYIFYFITGSALLFGLDANNSSPINDLFLDKDDPNYGWESDLESFDNGMPHL